MKPAYIKPLALLFIISASSGCGESKSIPKELRLIQGYESNADIEHDIENIFKSNDVKISINEIVHYKMELGENGNINHIFKIKGTWCYKNDMHAPLDIESREMELLKKYSNFISHDSLKWIDTQLASEYYYLCNKANEQIAFDNEAYIISVTNTGVKEGSWLRESDIGASPSKFAHLIDPSTSKALEALVDENLKAGQLVAPEGISYFAKVFLDAKKTLIAVKSTHPNAIIKQSKTEVPLVESQNKISEIKAEITKGITSGIASLDNNSIKKGISVANFKYSGNTPAFGSGLFVANDNTFYIIDLNSLEKDDGKVIEYTVDRNKMAGGEVHKETLMKLKERGMSESQRIKKELAIAHQEETDAVKLAKNKTRTATKAIEVSTHAVYQKLVATYGPEREKLQKQYDDRKRDDKDKINELNEAEAKSIQEAADICRKKVDELNLAVENVNSMKAQYTSWSKALPDCATIKTLTNKDIVAQVIDGFIADDNFVAGKDENKGFEKLKKFKTSLKVGALNLSLNAKFDVPTKYYIRDNDESIQLTEERINWLLENKFGTSREKLLSQLK